MSDTWGMGCWCDWCQQWVAGWPWRPDGPKGPKLCDGCRVKIGQSRESSKRKGPARGEGLTLDFTKEGGV